MHFVNLDRGFRSGALAWINRGVYTVYVCLWFMWLRNLHWHIEACQIWSCLIWRVYPLCKSLPFGVFVCSEFPDLLHWFKKLNLSLSSAAGHTERVCFWQDVVWTQTEEGKCQEAVFVCRSVKWWKYTWPFLGSKRIEIANCCPLNAWTFVLECVYEPSFDKENWTSWTLSNPGVFWPWEWKKWLQLAERLEFFFF